MNVFEDLVIELQQENLLERTVIDGEHWQNGHAVAEKSEFHDEDVDEPVVESHAKTAIETEDGETDTSIESVEWDADVANETMVEAPDAEAQPMRLKQKNSSWFMSLMIPQLIIQRIKRL